MYFEINTKQGENQDFIYQNIISLYEAHREIIDAIIRIEDEINEFFKSPLLS